MFDYVQICNVLNSGKFKSQTNEEEGLSALKQLIIYYKDGMAELSGIWGPIVYRRLLASEPKLRLKAEEVTKTILMSYFPPPPEMATALHKDFTIQAVNTAQQQAANVSQSKEETKTFIDQFEAFWNEAQTKQDQGALTYATRIWGYFALILGSAFFAGALANKLLRLIEKSFVSEFAVVRSASYDSWRNLVLNL